MKFAERLRRLEALESQETPHSHTFVMSVPNDEWAAFFQYIQMTLKHAVGYDASKAYERPIGDGRVERVWGPTDYSIGEGILKAADARLAGRVRPEVGDYYQRMCRFGPSMTLHEVYTILCAVLYEALCYAHDDQERQGVVLGWLYGTHGVYGYLVKSFPSWLPGNTEDDLYAVLEPFIEDEIKRDEVSTRDV